MKVRTKLQIVGILPVVSAVIICMIVFFTRKQINEAMEQDRIAGEIIMSVFHKTAVRDEYLLKHEERAKIQWYSEQESIENLLVLASVTFKGKEERVILDAMSRAHTRTGELFSLLVTHFKRPDPGKTPQEFYERIVGQLFISSQSIISDAYRLERATRERLLSSQRKVNVLIIGSLVLLAGGIGIVSFLIGRRVAKHVKELHEAAEIIAGGNLNYEISVESHDEIGQLTSAFNEMTGNLRKSYDDLEKEVAVRRRAEEEVRLASVYARSLIEASLDPLVTISANGKIMDVNTATERVTGFPRGELIGSDFRGYFTEPDRARSGYQHVFKEGFVQDYALEIRHRNGNITPVIYNASLYRDENGEVTGVFAAARDVATLKKAEKELQSLNAELEQRVAARTSQLEAVIKELEGFSYSVSHDLRAPLRAIDGFSKILLDGWSNKLDDEGRRLLTIVGENTKKMGQLIDDILAFSRVGRRALQVTSIDMEEMACDVSEELRVLETGRSVEIRIGHLPPAGGDPAMIRQVFVNIFSNAIKFTKTKDTATIDAGSFARDGENVYYVKDNGVGFDMLYAQKLFGVFQRLHSAEEFEGTGIGLAIVSRIITKHGGRVWAEGKVNEGATFFFSLPGIKKPDSQSGTVAEQGGTI